ncbi:MAG: glucose-6-phosphate isomerase [Candidatus Omnitrophica bacterium]|nr:glucose-6-phosphate isomerase [Candidatus Omnitrophota bacterium]
MFFSSWKAYSLVKRFFALTIVVSLLLSPATTYAQVALPLPGAMVNPSTAFVPVLMKGVRVHPENPLLFDFIIDTGDKAEYKGDANSVLLRTEAEKLMKYFLATLTIPEKDMWVNLSPYEKDRMTSDALGQTEMGRDLLAQDYILKQITATMMDPEKNLGKAFWNRVYAKAQEQFGNTDIPVDTFNKVWITVDKADVVERNNTAFVVGSHLKVMLESDYLAASKADAMAGAKSDSVKDELAKQIIREILIPEIEKEVNNGANFAPLRQMYYSVILASWFKDNLKEALLNQVYADKTKTNGVDASDKSEKDRIYQQYLEAYKKGVVNLIKEETDPATGEVIPRKYFSGGMVASVHPKVIDFSQAPTGATDPKGEFQMFTTDIALTDSSQASGNDRQVRLGNRLFFRDVINKTIALIMLNNSSYVPDFFKVPTNSLTLDQRAIIYRLVDLYNGEPGQAKQRILHFSIEGNEAVLSDGDARSAEFIDWLSRFRDRMPDADEAMSARQQVFQALNEIIAKESGDIKTQATVFQDALSAGKADLVEVRNFVAQHGPYIPLAAEDAAQTAVLPRTNPTETGSWNILRLLANNSEKRYNLRELFELDPRRAESASFKLNGEIEVDFSKNLLDENVLKALISLGNEVSLPQAIQQMFKGEKINETENRAVLHTALRNVKREGNGKLVAANGPVFVDGQDVMPKVIAVLEKMEGFTKKVQSGEWRGASGKKIKNIINVGIGGSDLGPKMAAEALKPYKAGEADAYFLSNIDGTAAAELMKKLDPQETLVVIVSKTFTTQETVQNAETLKKWVLDSYEGDESVIKKHFVAVSTAKDLVKDFGIDPENMFEFWDWVGGRYSVWSAVGLTLATYIGFDNFFEFLEGARETDDHFRTEPIRTNIPVIKALLNVWYGNFLGAGSFAILPYDQYMSLFPAFAEQFFMESNGKSVDRDGKPVDYETGLISWGAAGTDGQHSFYQLIHQGTRVVPADFIGVIQSHNELPGHQDKLFSNFVAQTEALAFGATTEEVKAILEKDPKYAGKDLDWNAMHQTFTGNKPTTSILINKVTPRNLGALTAMYENQIFTEGIIWNIFSFDQWGVELGKRVAKDKVLPFLDGTRPFSELSVVGLSPSAQRAIGRYLEVRANADKAMAEYTPGSKIEKLRPVAETRAVAFGTSGDRGKLRAFNEKGEFDIEHVSRLAEGTARYSEAEKPGQMVLIGYDPREGNQEFSKRTAQVLAAHRLTAVVIADNPTPTPVLAKLAADKNFLAYLARKYNLRNPQIGGVVNFTASHNPYTDDGFKYSDYHGGAAPKAVTDKLTQYSNKAQEYAIMNYEEAQKRGLIIEVSQKEAIDFYVHQYLMPELKRMGAFDDFKAFLSNNPNFHLVIDAMQGTGGEYIKELYASMAREMGVPEFFEVINTDADSRFSNVAGEPRPDNPASRQGLTDKVKAYGGNALGISVDGDSDRYGNVDPDGTFVGSNDLIPLMAYFLINDLKLEGAIGKTVATSNFVNAVAVHFGREVDEEAVGFKNFVAQVVSNNRQYVVAGEESAHVAVGPFMSSWDDGIVVGLMALWIKARTGMSLIEYKREVQKQINKKFLIETINLGLNNQAAFDRIKELIKDVNAEMNDGIAYQDLTIVKQIQSLQDKKVVDVIRKDGVKLVFDDGSWMLLRPSGTQILTKLYVETAGEFATPDSQLSERFNVLKQVGEKIAVGGDSAQITSELAQRADDFEDEASALSSDAAMIVDPKTLELLGEPQYLGGRNIVYHFAHNYSLNVFFNPADKKTYAVMSRGVGSKQYRISYEGWDATRTWAMIINDMNTVYAAEGEVQKPDRAMVVDSKTLQLLGEPQYLGGRNILYQLTRGYRLSVFFNSADQKTSAVLSKKEGSKEYRIVYDGWDATRSWATIVADINAKYTAMGVAMPSTTDVIMDPEQLELISENQFMGRGEVLLSHGYRIATHTFYSELGSATQIRLFVPGHESPFSINKQGEVLAPQVAQDLKGVLLQIYQQAGLNIGDKINKDSAQTPGGIDLNAEKLNMNVKKGGQGVQMNLDPAMIEKFKNSDFTGLKPVIINVVPVTSILPLLGLEVSQEQKLASI